MKFILISPERVNVYLTHDDMVLENINLEDLYERKPGSNKKLTNIFDMAKNVSGFNSNGCQYEIDVIPIIGGELLLSISKVDEDKEKIYVKGNSVCCFTDSFDSAAEAVLRVKDLFTGDSSIYKYGGKYYILLKIYRIEIEKIRILNRIINEFAEKSPLRDIVIREHGKCIADKNAAEIASVYLSG